MHVALSLRSEDYRQGSAHGTDRRPDRLNDHCRSPHEWCSLIPFRADREQTRPPPAARPISAAPHVVDGRLNRPVMPGGTREHWDCRLNNLSHRAEDQARFDIISSHFAAVDWYSRIWASAVLLRVSKVLRQRSSVSRRYSSGLFASVTRNASWMA